MVFAARSETAGVLNEPRMTVFIEASFWSRTRDRGAVKPLSRRTPQHERLRLEEREQVRVHLVLEGRGQAMGRARIDLQRCVPDDLGREHGRGADRDRKSTRLNSS